MEYKDLPQRIRILMKQKKLTQKELADLLGISQPAISLYLKGRVPPADILFRIAGIGETTVDWLLSGDVQKSEYTVREKIPLYGNQQLLLNLWDKLPATIQKDILMLIRHMVEGK
jgi:transcriptional regulator with XRE-family HTH domain